MFAFLSAAGSDQKLQRVFLCWDFPPWLHSARALLFSSHPTPGNQLTNYQHDPRSDRNFVFSMTIYSIYFKLLQCEGQVSETEAAAGKCFISTSHPAPFPGLESKLHLYACSFNLVVCIFSRRPNLPFTNLILFSRNLGNNMPSFV